MDNRFQSKLSQLRESGNFRTIRKAEMGNHLMDLSSNDYLAIGENKSFKEEFFNKYDAGSYHMTSSASRLLSPYQEEYLQLENLLATLYGKSALLFNSGYHANVGIITALADKKTLIVADKLVHASIIDGIILSKAPFTRFIHNDLNHLESILKKEHDKYESILIVTESVFSMDGDKSNLKELVSIRNKYPNTALYVDEAHAFGVFGEKGLGLAEEKGLINDIDIIVGTFGKAGASMGAFAITSPIIKDYLINSARSFIFSTSLPPINCMWSKFVIEKIIGMKEERLHLQKISNQLYSALNPLNGSIVSESQIVPFIIGDSKKTLELSQKLREIGYIVLPIRTPTVPPNTERIRFSLNSSITQEEMDKLLVDLNTILL